MKIMRIAILGFGSEGQAMLRALKRDPAYRSAEITILDRNKKAPIPKGVRAILGPGYLDKLSSFDIIFRTPGFPYMNAKLQAARRKGVEVSSVTRYFFERVPCPIIGVTGTKGKGTTTTLLCEILKRAGRGVYLAGNIGLPAVALLPRLRKNDLVILELSSFQLQDLDRSPRVAGVLDIFPDHQDAHRDMKEYVEAKSRVAKNQKPGDRVFFFADNGWSRWVAKFGKGKKIAVEPAKPSFISPSDMAMPGAHNFRNAVMASTIAASLGVSRETIRAAVRAFRGLEHRLELVREVGRIRFYNDSASTNPDTAAAACRSFEDPAVLIAGGKDKNLDYAPLAEALKSSAVEHVVLFGENREKIRRALAFVPIPLEFAASLEEAAESAYRAARLFSSQRSAVIFSPGAASFDMFKNYKDRGERFKKVVMR
ncbi:MAG: UDP-N-acetylmuramoyl-L-alanine--D-glutamate ligase, partial [Candidatus Liptonbacteria bacterium]|nr:UDP-N-acetylmuramoyl-L-alanine--D-glutamate ligase [Candidatus Liptonbacteria bacterium]